MPSSMGRKCSICESSKGLPSIKAIEKITNSAIRNYSRLVCSKCKTRTSICSCGKKKTIKYDFCQKCIRERNKHFKIMKEKIAQYCCNLHGKCELKGTLGCCYCCDTREFSEDGLYIEYIDGPGDKCTKYRYPYCPVCKNYGNKDNCVNYVVPEDTNKNVKKLIY